MTTSKDPRTADVEKQYKSKVADQFTNEKDGSTIFVLENGTRIRLQKLEPKRAAMVNRPPTAKVIDPEDGVDDEEASIAGKALAERKGKKDK